MTSLFGEVHNTHGAGSCCGAVFGSGSLANATDMHNAAADGEDRRRAGESAHPTGAGVSAWREKDLLMALLVPACG